MSRFSNNSRCLLLLSALTAALLWLLPVRSARAAVYTYNARQRTINAGVLFVGSAAGGAPDPAPYVFYVLNQRPDVKPVGWTFINPLAQSTVTTAMIARWNGAYKTGASLTPDMASYWEVPLRDVSADDLQQFDVLYLSASGVGFLPADNEKLRRFVDNGGQLIVEYGAAGGAPALFDSAVWATAGTTSALSSPTAPGGFDLHPLITQPNLLSPLTDFPFLGTYNPGGSYGTVMQNSLIFSTVLRQGSGNDAVDAAQLGGGQIVTSALNIGPTVSISQGAFFGSAPFFAQGPYITGPSPYSPTVVPAADLKFLSNVISWTDAHPNENKTSHQNSAGPSSASFAAAWNYPLASSAASAPGGAAVWGNYIYVTDAAGVLHAFDAIPDEFLTAGGSADDGIADFGSATPTSYDEVWNANVGAHASAPTVGSFQGTSYVFVEKANGSVVEFPAVNNVAAASPAKTFAALGSATFGNNAPAPTYYDGRIYAGQADGTLLVYSLNGSGSAGGGAAVPVDPQTISNESVTASPAVGILEGGTVSNSIVAYVPTTQNMNTVLLGARNDPLIAFAPNGQFGGYNINRSGRYNLFSLFADPSANPAGQAYDSSGGNVIAISGGQDPVYSATLQLDNTEGFFGNWDADFLNSAMQNGTPQAGLTLHEIKATSLADTANGAATLSAPAIDRKGDYYYVVDDGTNSYLFGVHDDIAQRNVLIKFRFRLPKTNDPSTIDPVNGSTNWSSVGNAVDADNVNYADPTVNANGAANSLLDFRFVGAPVVDGQGNVYVAAQGNQTINGNATTVAAVLCFNADQEATAEAGTVSSGSTPTFNRQAGFDTTEARYFQNDESTGNPQNPLIAIPGTNQRAGRYGQLSTAGSTASVFNFGRGSGGSRQIAGNLSEPQPFTAAPTPQSGSTATWMYFHTNMAWHATFPVNGAISGLSKTGNTLLLCDSGGNSTGYNTLYKLPAAPTVGIGKLAALTVRKSPLGTALGGTPLNIGAVAAAPSAGGGAMVINGASGIAAFNQQLTLIADNNRILEVDADGNAVWSADATTRLGDNGLSTKVDFAHPSALAQFAPNDYLVADTGNNRCVRFDRGGGVIWELTRFYDPSSLMAPGQPFTLSHPSSVDVRREQGTNYTDPVTGKPKTSQLVHYLIADTGNDRIVEVTDTLDASGNVLYFDLSGNVVAPGTNGSVTHDHLLTWVTHTGDQSGRHYHYAGASYLDIPITGSSDVIQVFALVTNMRLAQPGAGGQLAPASADAPGGCIVAFNRPLNPAPFSAITGTATDLAYVAPSFTAVTTKGTLTFPVQNPRFLHVTAPPQVPVANANLYHYSFLYADDNGAFELNFTSLTTPPVSYSLAFTQADYRNMTAQYGIPADFQGNVPHRNGVAASGSTPAIPAIPFVPTCVQRLNHDATNLSGTSHIERYLITQSYSQGELGRQPGQNAPTRLGGEIFEVDVSTVVSGGSTTVINDPVGGFGGGLTTAGTPSLSGFTLSQPVGASPLTQPTFAIRTAQ